MNGFEEKRRSFLSAWESLASVNCCFKASSQLRLRRGKDMCSAPARANISFIFVTTAI